MASRVKASREVDRCLEYAHGDRKFAAWLRLVNALCAERYEVGIFDLPDYLWRDEYDNESAPKASLDAAVEWGILT